MSGNSTPDPPPDLLVQSSQAILLLDEGLAEGLARNKAYCPKCNSFAPFKKLGRGGAIAKNLLVPLQLLCTFCKKKTVLRTLLEENASRADGDSQGDIEVIDGTATPFISMLEEFNTARKKHQALHKSILATQATQTAKNRNAPKAPSITRFFQSTAQTAKRARADSSDEETPIVRPDSAPPRTESFSFNSLAQHAPAVTASPEITPALDHPAQDELIKARARIQELEKENQDLLQQLADFRATYQSNMQANEARFLALENAIRTPTVAAGNRRLVPGLKPIAPRPNPTARSSVAAGQPAPSSQAPPTVPQASWATVVNKQTRREAIKLRKKIDKAFAPRTDPAEFVKVHIAIPNNSSLKACPPRDKRKWLRQACKSLNINKFVFDVSKIGNSIMEIYIPELAMDEVVQRLDDKGAVRIAVSHDKIPDYAPASTEALKKSIINRLASLYRFARLVRLRECILRGYSEEIQNAVKEKTAMPVNTIDASVPPAGVETEGNSQ